MDYFFLSSYFLAITSLFSIIFKAVSDGIWNGPGESQSFALKDADNTDERYVHLHDVILMSEASNGLTWASIGIGSALALLSICARQRAKAKGPLHCTRLQRLAFYSTYHAGLVFSLATYVYLTSLHGQSDGFRPVTTFPEVDGAKTCRGLCSGEYSGFRLDRETWVCDIRAAPEVSDSGNILITICVAETAARGLMLVLGLAIGLLAALLEWDRRKGGTFLRSWKTRARHERELDEM